MVRRMMMVGAVAFLACGAATLGATPADAAGSAATGKHCRMSVETGSTSCYRSVGALLASFGVQRPDASSIGQAEVTAIQAQPDATYVLSVVYDKENYDIADGSYTFYASAGCDGDMGAEWLVGNVGATWNDRITSYQGFNKCQSALYEDANFAGSQFGTKTNSMNVGNAMNDKTTSIAWS